MLGNESEREKMWKSHLISWLKNKTKGKRARACSSGSPHYPQADQSHEADCYQTVHHPHVFICICWSGNELGLQRPPFRQNSLCLGGLFFIQSAVVCHNLITIWYMITTTTKLTELVQWQQSMTAESYDVSPSLIHAFWHIGRYKSNAVLKAALISVSLYQQWIQWV